MRHAELVADALAEMAGTDGRKPEDLVAEAARLQGLLSLAWDGDVSQLARALPAHGGSVVLPRRCTVPISGWWIASSASGTPGAEQPPPDVRRPEPPGEPLRPVIRAESR